MDIRQFLSQQGFQWIEKDRPSGKIALMQCPECKDKEKSFAVSLVDGAFNCTRLNNCGIKGSFWDLQKLLGIQHPQRLDGNEILRLPPKYERPKVHSQKADKAIEWLKNRGIWESTVTAFKIGQFNDEIMFAYFKNGELVNIKYRSMKEKKFRQEKNAEPVLYGRDFCKGESLIIVEGEIDCMTFSQWGYESVSIPGGANDQRWIETEWDFLQRFKKIYLCLDNDEAGQKPIEEIVNRLGKWRCYNVLLPLKDANECLMKGIDDKAIAEAIENAKNYDPEMLRNVKEYRNDIIELYEHPELGYGFSTPWEGLTNILKGWRDSEQTIWSGRSGAGKSTILNQVAYGLLKKNEKVIMTSLEMPPKRYLKWMVSMIKNQHTVKQEDVDSALSEISNLYVLDIQGEIEANLLIDIFDFAARKYGVKHFFIDSLMKITMPSHEEYKEQKLFCNALINKLAKIYKGHVHLVAHPRKGFKDDDQPDKVDILGSSDITNLADNVIILHRISEEKKKQNLDAGKDSCDALLTVKKNREHGLEGSIKLKFNLDTKTFTEI